MSGLGLWDARGVMAAPQGNGNINSAGTPPQPPPQEGITLLESTDDRNICTALMDMVTMNIDPQWTGQFSLAPNEGTAAWFTLTLYMDHPVYWFDLSRLVSAAPHRIRQLRVKYEDVGILSTSVQICIDLLKEKLRNPLTMTSEQLSGNESSFCPQFTATKYRVIDPSLLPKDQMMALEDHKRLYDISTSVYNMREILPEVKAYLLAEPNTFRYRLFFENVEYVDYSFLEWLSATYSARISDVEFISQGVGTRTLVIYVPSITTPGAPYLSTNLCQRTVIEYARSLKKQYHKQGLLNTAETTGRRIVHAKTSKEPPTVEQTKKSGVLSWLASHMPVQRWLSIRSDVEMKHKRKAKKIHGEKESDSDSESESDSEPEQQRDNMSIQQSAPQPPLQQRFHHKKNRHY